MRMITDAPKEGDIRARRAVVFDLDGTLTASKSPLSREAGAALAALFARLPVAVMSGGWFPQFEKQFLPFLPRSARLGNLFLFPSSASACYTFKEGAWKPRYHHAFSEEERARVLRALDEALRETGLSEPPQQLWGERIEDRGSQITFSGLGQQAPVPEKKRWDPDQKKRMPVRDTLLKRLPGFSVAVNAYSSVDITREGITKAYGIRRLSEMLGIPIAGMLYVGDALFSGGNDAVVHETGIPTREVSGPAETLELLRELSAHAESSRPGAR